MKIVKIMSLCSILAVSFSASASNIVHLNIVNNSNYPLQFAVQKDTHISFDYRTDYSFSVPANGGEAYNEYGFDQKHIFSGVIYNVASPKIPNSIIAQVGIKGTRDVTIAPYSLSYWGSEVFDGSDIKMCLLGHDNNVFNVTFQNAGTKCSNE